MKVWDGIPTLYSTPRRETLSYVSIVFSLAATTLLWNASAFWPWSILTAGCLVALTLAGAQLSKRDTRAKARP
ncbi:hypothetical protein [Cryobacterium serini]|uniref:Uncharacterized protein n=1 Tax=Cryobacterium serini TaxID=1259201 RepID=A0A4R9BQV8_9MICO|nr:hypothetical protein [Cryobacterium serini]TFD88940.1 hypothetical protein E3T51_06330 [Cryobacterium serini]